MMSSEFNNEKEALSNRLLNIEEKSKLTNKKYQSPEQILKLIKQIVSFDSISPLLIGQLIESIEVYKSKKIIVNYKFHNPFL